MIIVLIQMPFLFHSVISFTFFAGKKVTKNLVTQKTRFFIQASILVSGLLSRLFLFHSHHFLALWPKSGLPISSNSFGSQYPTPRNDFFQLPLSRG
jgi:hypothetical protein